MLGMAMSQHHTYFLYEDTLAIISKLTNEAVFQITFDLKSNDKCVGLAFESSSESVFVSTNRFVYQILINQEDRDV